MHRYCLEGVFTKDKSEEILKELIKKYGNVIGVCVIYSIGELYVDFEKEPDNETLKQLKKHFNARHVRKVELPTEEL